MDGLAHARRCALVVGTVTGTHANMPLLLTEACLPSEMFDADGTFPAQSGGGDIRFSSDQAGTTALPCEIVLFTTDNNPALGTARIWVKVPSVATGTTFYVWYNTVATDSQPAVGASNGRNAVWSGYALVSHGLTGSDSTGNHTLTPTGALAVPGPFGDTGGGRGFGATQGTGTADVVATTYTGNSVTRTWSMWLRFNATGGGGLGRPIHKNLEDAFFTTATTYRYAPRGARRMNELIGLGQMTARGAKSLSLIIPV